MEKGDIQNREVGVGVEEMTFPNIPVIVWGLVCLMWAQ